MPTTMTRPSARASCEHCAWEAVHTDDDPVDLARFLRDRLIAHCTEQHPNIFSGLLPAPIAPDQLEIFRRAWERQIVVKGQPS